MIVSVGGQMIVGFGLALLLNRDVPAQGAGHDAAAAADDAVDGGGRPVLEAALRPVLGLINYALGLGKFDWLSDPEHRALRHRHHRHLDVVAVRDAAVARRPVGRAASTSTRRRRSTAPARWYTFTRITLPLVAPLLLIALIFRTMEAFKTFDLAFIMSGQPTTELISIRLYKMAFQEWQTGQSCALAYIVLIVVLAITNIYVKYLNQVKER